jgi:hypothetical protein
MRPDRVYLGDHYPTDVQASFGVALAAALLVSAAFELPWVRGTAQRPNLSKRRERPVLDENSLPLPPKGGSLGRRLFEKQRSAERASRFFGAPAARRALHLN